MLYVSGGPAPLRSPHADLAAADVCAQLPGLQGGRRGLPTGRHRNRSSAPRLSEAARVLGPPPQSPRSPRCRTGGGPSPGQAATPARPRERTPCWVSPALTMGGGRRAIMCSPHPWPWGWRPPKCAPGRARKLTATLCPRGSPV